MRSPHPISRRSILKTLAIAPVCLSFPHIRAGEPATAGVGKTFNVGDEVQELKDADTGARVMRLTGGNHDNVHLYFTSESFLQDSNHIVFGSNRSGKFQHYLMDIRAKKLTQ